MDSEVTKTRKGRKKKTILTINEVEENDVRDKRERLIQCVLSGNSKQYLGKEYTEQQINEMNGNNINILSNRYESVLTRWSFSTQNAPGRRNLSFYLHLPKFVCVKAAYPSDYKIFLSSFVKFVFIIG